MNDNNNDKDKPVRTNDSQSGTRANEHSASSACYLELFKAVCRYRNVSRGWRAEDKTKELPDVSDEEIDRYESELRLKMFEMADAIEDSR